MKVILTESQLKRLVSKSLIKEDEGMGMEEPNETKEMALKAIDMFFTGTISSIIGKDPLLVELVDTDVRCGDNPSVNVYYSFDVLKNYHMSFKLHGTSHFDDNFTELDGISKFEFGLDGEGVTYTESSDGECLQKLLDGKFSDGKTLEDFLNEESQESIVDCVSNLKPDYDDDREYYLNR